MAKNTDFIGFTFNNRHSSEFHIYSVSDGSRYQDILVPNPIDYSEEIPGGIGQNYFGSDTDIREFSLSIAYDNLSELQLREMRKWLSPNTIGELIFDERPYKTYIAKISSSPSLSYICFDKNGKKERVYKGEGDISFICYYSYAKTGKNVTPGSFKEIPVKVPVKINVNVSEYTEDPNDLNKWEWLTATCEKAEDITNNSCKFSFTYLDQPRTIVIKNLSYILINKQELQYYKNLPDKYSNINEWEESSGLIDSLSTYNIFESRDGRYGAKLYNPGDRDTSFKLSFHKPAGQMVEQKFWLENPITNEEKLGYSITVSARADSNTDINKYGPASEDEIEVAKNEGDITIDTEKNLITFTFASSGITKSAYFLLKKGFFFKIPPTTNGVMYAQVNGIQEISLDYDYLYY